MSRTGKTWLVWIGIALVACTDPTQPSTAVQLAFAVQPSNATAGVFINPGVAVAIQDASGNLVTNATNVVTVTIASTASGGSLAGTVSVPAVNGVATFSNVRIVTAGRGYTLKAASTGLAAATSTQFAIAAAAASHLAFTVQPSQTVQGAAITPPVQVAAQDSFGNLATEFQDSVTVALPGNPPIASLSGTTVVRAVNGVATFNDLSIAATSASDMLTASAGGLASVSSIPFAITPPPGSLHVTTATTGVSFPAGYGLCVDPFGNDGDCTTSVAVGVNSGVSLSVARGTHVVDLTAAANCTVSDGSSRTVDVGAATDVSFAITCVAAGAVRVGMASTGIDVPDAYVVCFDQSGNSCNGSVVRANGTETFPVVIAGAHTVTLTSVARNCTVSGATTRALIVPQDGTVDVSFSVGCVEVERIAYSYNGTIVVGRVDGAYSPGITAGFAPAWSPNGIRLAYECGQDICAINADGTGFARLTVDGAGNHHPAWSPDRSKIAYAATHASVTELYVMTANGAGAARRTQGVGFVGSPAWSPDGTMIAFDCRVDAGNDDLCSVNADGTGFARLTNDPARDYGAAWKPDGSTLAFATTRYGSDEIALLNATSGTVTRIGAGLPGFAPSWSPDGTQLAFVQLVQRDYDGDWYTTSVISTAKADGSIVRYLTDGDQPAWKPHL
ncbi:MAG TPA: hypothetical protein VN908_00525 [Gemmatimonadales bacterium]|nr:hypothetical protein [Gemmatimonadales bacterium]